MGALLDDMPRGRIDPRQCGMVPIMEHPEHGPDMEAAYNLWPEVSYKSMELALRRAGYPHIKVGVISKHGRGECSCNRG